MFFSSIPVIPSGVLETIDSLQDIWGGRQQANLKRGDRAGTSSGFLHANTLFIEILSGLKDGMS